jgi:ubiquinone/menaquinone biosynthesis C-methylase UbiE
MLELARHGEVTGIELSSASFALARERHTGRVLAGSVLEMPFATDGFDLAVCLDVIEHLEDDRAALRELRRVVAPAGSLLVTVPAYERLWSAHDELNHHQRRYSAHTPQQAADAGWRSVRTTHFD